VPDVDLPFTAEGMIPDIVFNPAGIPSRMTINYILEALIGKAACLKGCTVDGTPFGSDTTMSRSDLDFVTKTLKDNGFDTCGWETMYHGETGRPIQAQIFMGPVCYQSLIHLAERKVHARGAWGNVVYQTRQPPQGKNRHGGLRDGHMEGDAYDAHGAAFVKQDRFCRNSDRFEVHLCQSCGGMVEPPRPHTTEPMGGFQVRGKTAFCRRCQTDEHVHLVEIPFTTVAHWTDMAAMGMRLILTPTEEKNWMGRRSVSHLTEEFKTKATLQAKHASDVSDEIVCSY
jgi:DNA-directed RNA polymerase beta subunit